MFGGGRSREGQSRVRVTVVLRHVTLFRWSDGITDRQKQAIHDGLARLPAIVTELRDYGFGDDAMLVEGNWDFAVVADFDGSEAWRAYREHPEHQRVLTEHIRPVAAQRASVQYWL